MRAIVATTHSAGSSGSVCLHTLKVPARLPLRLFHRPLDKHRGPEVGIVQGFDLNVSCCTPGSHTVAECPAVLTAEVVLAPSAFKGELEQLLVAGLLGFSIELFGGAEGRFTLPDGRKAYSAATVNGLALTPAPASPACYAEDADPRFVFWPGWATGPELEVFRSATEPEARRRGLCLDALTTFLGRLQ